MGTTFRPLLPPPTGVAGHLRYSLAAMRFLREWRRRLRALDADLSRAARDRDRLLGALGEAARAGLGDDPRVAAFGTTASILEEERAVADREREQAQSALDRARAELRRELQALETRITAAQGEVAPLAAERIRLEGRHEALVREREAVAARLRAAREGRARVDLGEDEMASLAAEQRQASAELEALDGALDEVEAALAAGEAELARRRERLEGLRRRYDQRRGEGEGRVAELEARVARLTARVEALTAREHATLVDLGHELAREPQARPGLEAAWRAARTGLERYEHCRTTRELLYVEGARLDRRPLRRTLVVAAALVGALLVALASH